MIEASRELLAPRADVWDLIAEPFHLPDWWPAYTGVKPDRRGLAENARWEVLRSPRPGFFRKPRGQGLIVIMEVAHERILRWHDVAQHIDAGVRLEAAGPSARSPPRSSTARSSACAPRARVNCRAKPSPACMTSARRVLRVFSSRKSCSPGATTSLPSPPSLALAVGILLGVAVSGKVSDATESFEEAERDRLRQDLRDANESLDFANRRRRAAEALIESAYPALMDRRLEGRRFTVVFLGPVQGDVRAAIERTLADAGSAARSQLIAIDTPIDGQELDDALDGDEELASFADRDGDYSELGEALGRELFDAEETALWGSLTGQLVEERAGTNSLAVEGAVVVRSWQPPAADTEEETRATETLLDGLLEGLSASGFPWSAPRLCPHSARSRRSTSIATAASRASTTSTRCPDASRSPCSSPAVSRATTG